MTMTPLSGPYGTYPTVVQGAQAAAAALNKVGGIQGHKIEIVSCDTKFDPNAAVACGRKAVSEEVVALAGSNDDTNGAYLPITQKEGIPDIGVTPNADAQAAGGLEFPIQGGSQLNQVAAGRMCAALGAKKIKTGALDIPSAFTLLQAGIPLGIKGTSTTWAGSVKIPLGTTDFAPIAQSILSGGTDCVGFALGSSQSPLLVKALRQTGYKGPIVSDASALLDPDMAKLGKLSANVFESAAVLPKQSTDPSVQKYIGELKANGVSDPIYDALGVSAWAAVYLIADVMNAAKVTDRAGLLTAIKAGGPKSYLPSAPFDLAKRNPIFPDKTNIYTTDVALTCYDENGDKQLLQGGKFVDIMTVTTLDGCKAS
jgi:ABC-type branched-subunit amino acid transport system substrate-binding protein